LPDEITLTRDEARFREVPVFEIKEVLRLWLRREGYRAIGRLVRLDRRTARGYIEAAQVWGLTPEGGEEQITDELTAAHTAASASVGASLAARMAG
jgi:hypothetical protein